MRSVIDFHAMVELNHDIVVLVQFHQRRGEHGSAVEVIVGVHLHLMRLVAGIGSVGDVPDYPIIAAHIPTIVEPRAIEAFT